MKTTIIITRKENRIANILPIISQMFQFKPDNVFLKLTTESLNTEIKLEIIYELVNISYLIRNYINHKKLIRGYSLQIYNKNDTILSLKLIQFYKEVVAKHLGLEPEDLDKVTRNGDIVKARQIAMYFAKNETKKSYQFIGNNFRGGMDHATIMHACKTVKNQIETNPKFRKLITEIEYKL